MRARLRPQAGGPLSATKWATLASGRREASQINSVLGKEKEAEDTMGSGYNPRNYLHVTMEKEEVILILLLSKWVVSVGLQISTKRDSEPK